MSLPSFDIYAHLNHRLFGVPADPYPNATPEYFGASGDGVTDDWSAIQTCLTTYNYCQLADNTTYGITNRLTLAHNGVLKGRGHNSVIKLLDYASGNLSLTPYFSMVESTGDILADSNNILIKDLHLNCNFENQNRKNTTQGIEIYGQNNVIDGVKVTHFGVGTGDLTRHYECFAIASRPAHYPTGRVTSGNVIRNCEITEIADQTTQVFNYALGRPMATCIACGGLSTSDIMQLEARVENNYIHDMSNNSGTNKLILNGLTVGGTSGSYITNNRVINFGGASVYQDSWQTYGVTIRNNTCHNVRIGIFLYCYPTTFYSDYRNVIIENNHIILMRNNLNYFNVFENQLGIALERDSDFTGILIRNNFVSGGKYISRMTNGELTGVGMWTWFINSRYTGIRVVNNIFETNNWNRWSWQQMYDGQRYFWSGNTDYTGAPALLSFVDSSGVWKSGIYES